MDAEFTRDFTKVDSILPTIFVFPKLVIQTNLNTIQKPTRHFFKKKIKFKIIQEQMIPIMLLAAHYTLYQKTS